MNKITDLDWHIEYAERSMALGKTLEQIHPRLKTHSFCILDRALKHGLNWMWLQTQKGTSQRAISGVMVEIVTRELSAYGVVTRQACRGCHDHLLLCASILAGDRDLTKEVASLVTGPGVPADLHDYWRSCIGILTSMLAGDKDQASHHFMVLSSCRGKEVPIPPAKKPVFKAFVAGDTKGLQRNVRSVGEAFWKLLEQLPKSAGQSRQGDIELGTGWNYNRFWPWPEAAILRVLYQGGAEFKADEFWMPTKLITGKG